MSPAGVTTSSWVQPARRLAGEVGDRGGDVLRARARPRAGGRPSGCAPSGWRRRPRGAPRGRRRDAAPGPATASARGRRTGRRPRARAPASRGAPSRPRPGSGCPSRGGPAPRRPRGGSPTRPAGSRRSTTPAGRAGPSTIGPPPKLWSRGGAAAALTTRSRPPEVALGPREGLGHHGVVGCVAAHPDDPRVRLAQRVEGLLRSGPRRGRASPPPAGRPPRPGRRCARRTRRGRVGRSSGQSGSGDRGGPGSRLPRARGEGDHRCGPLPAGADASPARRRGHAADGPRDAPVARPDGAAALRHRGPRRPRARSPRCPGTPGSRPTWRPRPRRGRSPRACPPCCCSA